MNLYKILLPWSAYISKQQLDLCKKIEFDDLVNDTRCCQKNNVMIVTNRNINHIEILYNNNQSLDYQAIISYQPLSLPSKIPVIVIQSLTNVLPNIIYQAYNIASTKAKIIGITGTNGKTSIVNLIAQLLVLKNYKVGVLGTLGNGIYDNQSQSLKESTHTTLETLDLYQNIHQFNQQNVDFIAIEVSSHGLVQNRLGKLIFDIVVFTNLTQDHLDYHQTMQNYFLAKQKLFTDFVSEKTQFVINIDDDYGKKIVQIISKQLNGYTVSVKPNNSLLANICAKNIQYCPSGLNFTIEHKEDLLPINSHLFGLSNVYNLLIIYAIARLLEIKELNAKNFGQLKTVKGRMQQLEKKSNSPQVIVDYAHTPDALAQTLIFAKEHLAKKGKIFCVFGCGGNRDQDKREKMGAIAVQFAHNIIITDDNPRFENPAKIRQQILSGIVNKENVVEIGNRKEAIQYAVNKTGCDDLIIIAGKGHEKYQIIGDKKFPFDDIKEVNYAIRQL